jgi:pyruvate dehydrogenase E1 component beta subunit
MERQLTVAAAIREATDQCLAQDQTVYLMGLGAADPKGVFGTTIGLKQKYPNRVFEMPVAENGMTGVAIGSALAGMRPVMTHQRLDFALMGLEQIINNAAKWRYMFGGAMKLPLTVRIIIGQGWGQGPQHAQTLQAVFMHIPGLKVVMPFNPYDAKGLLISSIEEDNPVIFIEHRWLHNIKGVVPEEVYRVPLGQARTIRPGEDVTVVSVSSMLPDCLKAADALSKIGVSLEVIDLRTIKPYDKPHILESVRKTGRLIVADSGYITGGLAAEICAFVAEKAYCDLKAPLKRLAAPDCPAPTSRALIRDYYPTANDIIQSVFTLLGLDEHLKEELMFEENPAYDVPDASFTGPF